MLSIHNYSQGELTDKWSLSDSEMTLWFTSKAINEGLGVTRLIKDGVFLVKACFSSSLSKVILQFLKEI